MINDKIHQAICSKFSLPEDSKSPLKVPLNRDELALFFHEVGFSIGAEVGVSRGLYSEVLLKAIPGLTLYCIDPWEPYYETLSARKQRRVYQETQSRLSAWPVKYIVKRSMDALADIADDSLDFVYIDANHDFEHASEDVPGWYKRVRKGGILAGHDYAVFPKLNFGIIPAVDKFVEDNNLFLYLTAERYKSWFVVKE